MKNIDCLLTGSHSKTTDDEHRLHEKKYVFRLEKKIMKHKQIQKKLFFCIFYFYSYWKKMASFRGEELHILNGGITHIFLYSDFFLNETLFYENPNQVYKACITNFSAILS